MTNITTALAIEKMDAAQLREERRSTAMSSTVTATIPAGDFISSPVDLTNNELSLIFAPEQWTPAQITFQVSPDNVNFADLFDAAGLELARPLRPNTAIGLPTVYTKAALYLRIRSGPRSAP